MTNSFGVERRRVSRRHVVKAALAGIAAPAVLTVIPVNAPLLIPPVPVTLPIEAPLMIPEPGRIAPVPSTSSGACIVPLSEPMLIPVIVPAP